MQVSINVTGLKEVEEKINQIAQAGKDTAPLMAELSNHLYNVVDESFEKQQSPDGIAWSPIQQRANDKHPEKMLYDEGIMQGSLTASSDSGSASVGLNATAGGYPYPVVHQFGNEAGTLEARPFIPIHDDGSLYEHTKEELDQIVEEYIEEVLK